MTDTRPPLLLTDAVIAEQAERLARAAQRQGNRRFILGIAGIPGSGKSTLAQRLVDHTNRLSPDTAEIIAMDGFHFTNAELDCRGLRDRKGAPHTFDVTAYHDLLRQYAEVSNVGPFPEYRRDLHDPAESPRRITRRTRLIVTEGNYLLLDEQPWSALVKVFDETWWLDTPRDRARGNLRERDAGLGRSLQDADEKYERNDRFNTDHILETQPTPDRVVRWP